MTTSKVAQIGPYTGAPQKTGQVLGAQSDEFSKVLASQSASSGEKTQMDTKKQTENKTKTETEVTEDTRKVEDTTKSTEVKEGTSKDAVSDTEKTEKTENTTQTEGTKDASQETEEDLYTEEIMEAIAEIVATIQEILGVTPEKLQETLETLGLSVKDLLNPDKIPMVVVALTEGADELSVMTNEKLFADIKQISAKAESLLDSLAEQLDLPPESIKEMIQNMPQTEDAAEEEVLLHTKNDSAAEIPVTEESRVQVSVERPETSARREDGRRGTDTTANQQAAVVQDVLDRIEQAVTRTETTYSTFSTTENIMDQIRDIIKVVQTEDLTEMEMQLHPASLGHVRVQLSVREGVLTAAFAAENEAVKAVLESQILVLKQNFEEQGIKVEAVEVTVASHAFERNLDSSENGAGEEQAPEKKKSGRRISLSELLNEEAEEELSDEDRIVAEMMKQNGNTVDYTV